MSDDQDHGNGFFDSKSNLVMIAFMLAHVIEWHGHGWSRQW